MCNFRAPNLFSLYLCIQPSNCHKFKWFGFVWFSSFAECINYSVILWNKILQQRLLFSHCSPSSSLVSAHINCRTLIYCSSSALTALCAEEFMKFCAELTEIDVFTHMHKYSQPPSSFSFTFIIVHTVHSFLCIYTLFISLSDSVFCLSPIPKAPKLTVRKKSSRQLEPKKAPTPKPTSVKEPADKPPGPRHKPKKVFNASLDGETAQVVPQYANICACEY